MVGKGGDGGHVGKGGEGRHLAIVVHNLNTSYNSQYVFAIGLFPPAESLSKRNGGGGGDGLLSQQLGEGVVQKGDAARRPLVLFHSILNGG